MKSTILLLPYVLLSLSLLTGATGGSFEIISSDHDQTILRFSLHNVDLIEENDQLRFVVEDGGLTTDPGTPELPVFTTLFQMAPGVNYSVTATVLDQHELTAHPLCRVPFPEEFLESDQLEFDSELAQQFDTGPTEMLQVSDPLVMRNLEMIRISLVPCEYDTANEILTVYDEVELVINSAGNRPLSRAAQLPPSLAFDPLYHSMAVNYQSPPRDEYQQPAILYICGGGANGAITHPYFQMLVDWRQRRGYTVYSAHTGQTGSSNSQIKNYIENAYNDFDPPPEIVTFVGDVNGPYPVATFHESWSWHSGEGDHPYTTLDGDDNLPEIFVGRISVQNSNELANVINKTIQYEKASYTGDNWFEKAALVGDPNDSGLSTADANMYIQGMMEQYGMEDIRILTSGWNWSSWMQNQLDEGVLFFNYRGWGLFSGFTVSNINNANNGYKTPFVTFITCGTGSFSQENTALTEAFLRAGTLNNPKGAVSAIGTATLGTHTVYNNIVDMGVFEGVFSGGVETAGAALASGHLAIYRAYPWDPSNNTSIFTHWNNLMGDASLHLWTDTPTELWVVHPEEIGVGTNFFDVTVLDIFDNPVSGAYTTLHSEDLNIHTSAWTDETGQVRLSLDPQYIGEVFVTATGKNLKPSETIFNISQDGPVINVAESGIEWDDSEGNGNGLINPGESLFLIVTLNNYGNEDAEDVVAELLSDDQLILLSGTDDVGDLPIEGTGSANFEIQIPANTVQGDSPDLRLRISDASGNESYSLIPISITGSYLAVTDIIVNNGQGLGPGEEGDIAITLTNLGLTTASEVAGSFTSMNALVEVIEGDLFWGTLLPGYSVTCAVPAEIMVEDDVINGMNISFDIHVTNASGYDRTEVATITFGQVTANDPLGPDSYGYYIYGSEDLGYSLTYPFNWQEIDPGNGGQGVDLNLSDYGNGIPASQEPAQVDLPFTFTFYGVDYDVITVSTNGWVALGEKNMRSFRNYPIPGAGGPAPMIAAFWDDLHTSNGGEVFYFEDPAGEFVIIQWDTMRTYSQGSYETFQVILIDSLTPTGDDEVLIQYQDFNNTSIGDLDWGGITHGSYATIGIENHLGTAGLQVTYNNEWPTACPPRVDGTTLFITTRQPLALQLGDVNQDNDVNVQDIILIVNHIIFIDYLSPIEMYLADLDHNEIINILDIILLINVIIDM